LHNFNVYYYRFSHVSIIIIMIISLAMFLFFDELHVLQKFICNWLIYFMVDFIGERKEVSLVLTIISSKLVYRIICARTYYSDLRKYISIKYFLELNL